MTTTNTNQMRNLVTQDLPAPIRAAFTEVPPNASTTNMNTNRVVPFNVHHMPIGMPINCPTIYPDATNHRHTAWVGIVKHLDYGVDYVEIIVNTE
jgi:hypothetical protein